MPSIYIILALINQISSQQFPLVVNTWAFTEATKAAWAELKKGGDRLDALEVGCSTCEALQCDGTVGFGGSPDENGETTLDAVMFDGATMNMGAVAGLRRIKNAISVARHVLEHTSHSLLVGSLATEFGKQMGFKEEVLETNRSLSIWKQWKANRCQPNFWNNVSPNPRQSCGPYHTISLNSVYSSPYLFNEKNHDTIGMIVIDAHQNIAAGTSTNGATHKIPGRVGDSPIPGAGAYADNDVGAAAATGDGDVMMRFLPSFLAVEEMRRGTPPSRAAQIAINRILLKNEKFFGGIVVVNKNGEHGAACTGMAEFPYSIITTDLDKVVVKTVKCNV